jgi:hypothetical protein
MTDGRRGDTRVAADIAEYGWHGILVTDRADALDPDPHIWSYSIGLLETWQHPELVIFGLPRDTAHQILWNAVHEIEVGRRFSSLDRWEAFENGYEATFLEVDPRWLPFLGQALDYHGSDFPALQIAWPDRERRLPWQADYHSVAQPLLVSEDLAGSLGVEVDEASLETALGGDADLDEP